MTMTLEAKRRLSGTVRELRAYLLEALHAAVESEYRFAIKRAHDAGLDEARTAKRRRFEAWIAEQVRAEARAKKKDARTAEEFRREAEKQAAYTLLNRLVLLRLMEAAGLRSPHVVTGGWESRGYRDFRELAPALVREDPTEGYGFLLKLVFQDLAHDLPGLYGPAGIAELVPVGPAVLRRVVEALNDPALESCWTDDMTLGWVYQYWNDPEREALDAKLNGGGKVEPHEIAPKTQMFTERYMVDWLLQNSLGPMWLALCKKHGWTPAAEADGTLEALEARRAEWRDKREAGQVELTALMPLHTEMERRWAYYVPQPIPEEAVAQAPGSVRELKLLDPAVGSGHFLVVAFDLLFALYREEARHRGEERDPRWSDRAIVEQILEHNLHGIDLDPRAVQIAAAALWLKAKERCPDAEPRRMNLVASNLRLGSLSDDDPALVELRREVERETGVPGELTDTIVHALRGADHLGSLLKVDRAVDEAIEAHERAVTARFGPQQVPMFDALPAQQGGIDFEAATARQSLLDRLEGFLSRYTGGEDLGLRLRGEQLAAGVRFVRMVREGAYDLVVANPPYQGTSKVADAAYVAKQYPLGKADLYAAFLLRGLELVREGGLSSMVTMRNWMFIKQYAGLREHLLRTFDLRALGDFDRGAFEDVPDEVVSVAVSVLRRGAHQAQSVAVCPTPRDDRSRDSERTPRKRAATLCHVGRHEFDPAALQVVPEWPLVYWWDQKLLRLFTEYPALGSQAPVRQGLATSNNKRFLRKPWEIQSLHEKWHPFIKGGEGRKWIEPLADTIEWSRQGLEVKTLAQRLYGSYTRTIKNEEYYGRRGIAFTMIGHAFEARVHTYSSIIDVVGSSAYPGHLASALCALNTRTASSLLRSLNPTVHFQVGDLNRLPLFEIPCAHIVLATLEEAFSPHESSGCRSGADHAA